MRELDHTHDPALTSWVERANLPDAEFPIQNLPLGMYRKRGDTGQFRACTAIADKVLDLAAVNATYYDDLNALAAAGCDEWKELRYVLSMAAEVSYDVRGQILGHKDGDITAHYCKVPTTQLIEAVKRLETPKLPQLQRSVVSGYFGGPQSVEKQGGGGSYGWT